MTKQRDNKSDKNKDGLNKLSQLMLDQNESLRKLLEELTLKEKENVKKNADTNQYQLNNN